MSSNTTNYLKIGNEDFFCPQMNTWSPFYYFYFIFLSRRFLFVASEDLVALSLTFCIFVTNYFKMHFQFLFARHHYAALYFPAI